MNNPNWIPVTDKLPNAQDWRPAIPVLAYSVEDNRVYPAHFYRGQFYYYGEYYGEEEYGLLDGITHWMPFPPPPTA